MPDSRIKALTVCQPYAHLIAIGEKRIENRTWPTHHRGPLAIHAGKSRAWLGPDDLDKHPDMKFGAIVAVANLSRCFRIEALQALAAEPGMQWLATHEHTEGPWCWQLDDVVQLANPVFYQGKTGLWSVDTRTSNRLLKVWACAQRPPRRHE